MGSPNDSFKCNICKELKNNSSDEDISICSDCENRKMKTEITFKQTSETEISIIRDGKDIGHIWSEQKDGTLPYPSDKEKTSCLNSIQICGFDDFQGEWTCGPYIGKKDLVCHFRNDSGNYMQNLKKQYEQYVKNFFKIEHKTLKVGNMDRKITKLESTKDLDKLESFNDWLTGFQLVD